MVCLMRLELLRALPGILIGFAPLGALALDPQPSPPGLGDPRIKPGNGTINRHFADHDGKTPSILDFGGPVNGDWTAAFRAAEASDAKRIMLPPGRYPTTLKHHEAIGKTYMGPGQLVVGADSTGAGGIAEAPHRSFVTAPLPEVSDDRLKAFDGDWSKALPGGVAYSFIGAGATSAPRRTYTNFPQLSQTFRVFDNTAGFNTAPGDHAKGRSGIFADNLRVYHGGQGDLVGSTFFGSVYSTRAGATHWLANPAIVSRNGNISAEATAAGAYLNESEFVFSDNGAAVTAIGAVRNYVRTSRGNELQQVWVHDRPQSLGSQPIDAFYAPAGAARRGLDFTPADFGSDQRAIVLGIGQKIDFAGTSTPDSLGAKFYSDTLLGVTIHFEKATNSLVIDPGPGRNIRFSNLPTSAVGLPSGSVYRDKDHFLKVAP